MTRPLSWQSPFVVAVTSLLVLTLPLLMGNRTPLTLSGSGALLVFGGLLIGLAGVAGPARSSLQPLPAKWWLFSGVLTVWIVLQILPLPGLARALGAYPDALWTGQYLPAQWSPNPAASVRAWAVFMALMMIAWGVSSLDPVRRNLVWLVIAGSALFQAFYGLMAHASGAESIFGVWQRNNPGYVHGSFSNRNLYAGYLALTWPLVISVWWRRSMPLLSRLPFELRVAGAVICGAVVGAALLGSASRLGSAAGVFGMLVGLVLWTRMRRQHNRGATWPMYLAAVAALVAATWYGLTPLAERLAISRIEERRFDIVRLMLFETEPVWWLSGVGLGGFEAVFKQVQPGDMKGWYDFAHNDLLQWLFEMGIVGAGLLVAVLAAIWNNARLCRETIPLFAGLAALALVALGDFSWHLPATQVVLAVFIGTLLRKKSGHNAPQAMTLV
ncbi:MAG: O-antigen ligase family protein [Xanthomonadaceae bacterium]|nr:O-antigen ligase family protein [Xanthomonadaceae bacterium]